MAVTFDGIEIPRVDGWGGGAVFTLDDPAPISAEFESATGARVVLAAGSKGLVVSGLPATSYVDAWRDGLVAAQQGLDLFSVRGLVDLRLREPQHDHLAAYVEDGAQFLRIVGVATQTFNLSAHGVVTDADGNEVPAPAPVSVWHESMRYFRQAQLTDDLFESTRSLWLALENLLDAIEPAKKGESEERWLKRALARADAAIDLSRFLPAPQAAQQPPLPKNAAYRFFYDEMRTHLFHAKGSRRPLLPQETEGTNLVLARHVRLTAFYLALLEHHIGVTRRGSGVLARGGFELMMAGLDRSASIQVTGESELGQPTEETIDTRGKEILTVGASRLRDAERPFLRWYLGRIGALQVEAMRAVTRCGLFAEGRIVAQLDVDGDLQCSDLGGLEMQMGVRIRSAGPKSFAEM